MIAVQRLPAPQTNAPVSLRQQSERSLLLPAGIACGQGEQEGSRPLIASTPEPDLYEQPTFPVSPPSPTPPITRIRRGGGGVDEGWGRLRRPGARGRFVPTVLTVSCLLFLVASSLLAYIYINKKPVADKQVLNVIPNQLRVNDTFVLSGKGFGTNDLITFTHDKDNAPLLDGSGKQLQAHADDTGAFSIQVVVPANWDVGQHSIYAIDIGQGLSVLATIVVQQSSLAPPQLELSNTNIDFGANIPGVVSKKTITLINAGGRQLTWQAASDQPWLTASPNNGTFSGSMVTQITVNSGTLTPQSYAGHITLIQQGRSDQPLTLTVTITVKSAPPASLTLSPVSLIYSSTTAQNPGTQTITLQNTGGQPLDWSSSVVTGDGASWLTINPVRDHLAANTSETITVSVQSQQLAVGSYQGTINFKGGTNPAVTVALSVSAPGNLIASPPSLSFASQGQNPAPQSVALQNSGGEPLDWTVTATTVDGANWLDPTTASGHLEIGQSTNISINVNVATLKPQSYQGRLTFSYAGGSIKQVPVSLTVSVPPAASISLNQSALNFSTIIGNNPTLQTFTISNTGNATLNWAIAENQNGATFAPVSSTSGSLAPTKNIGITVQPIILQQGAGILTTNITVSDSDTGSKVLKKNITVTITVKDQPQISLSINAMGFSHNSTFTDSSQILVITNTGSQTLNWITQPSTSWLYADIPNGTLNPGTSIVIEVHCNSSGLPVGNFSGNFVVSDSDPGTSVVPQTITVNLVVS